MVVHDGSQFLEVKEGWMKGNSDEIEKNILLTSEQGWKVAGFPSLEVLNT